MEGFPSVLSRSFDNKVASGRNCVGGFLPSLWAKEVLRRLGEEKGYVEMHDPPKSCLSSSSKTPNKFLYFTVASFVKWL